MNHDLANKIRKLLRLAQLGGPEGVLAAERAEQLMQRHHIVVTLNDVVRVPLSNVAGIYWREQLLVTIARAYACKVLSSTQPPIQAVLAGEHPMIDDALDLFQRLSCELVIRCNNAWKKFARQFVPMFVVQNDDGPVGGYMSRRESSVITVIGDDGWTEIIGEQLRTKPPRGRGDYLTTEELLGFATRGEDNRSLAYIEEGRILGDEMFSVSGDGVRYTRSPRSRAAEAEAATMRDELLAQEKAAEKRKQQIKNREHMADNVEIKDTYFRLYLNDAVAAIQRRMYVAPEKLFVRQPPPDVNVVKRQIVLESEPTQVELAKDLLKIAELVGKDIVQQLQTSAQTRGSAYGQDANVSPRSRKFLTQDGSIPKPIPGRFSFLDFE